MLGGMVGIIQTEYPQNQRAHATYQLSALPITARVQLAISAGVAVAIAHPV
jgi:hypothetical protein